MKTIKEKLEDIRNDPKCWKAARAGGADMYLGLPIFIRTIDEILREFESGKVLIPVSEYDRLSKSDGILGPDVVVITKKHHDHLCERNRWLTCLESAGVDNWSGYDEAIEIENSQKEG